MSPPAGRRPYDSPRRRHQAEVTRADIATAARRLFTNRGWSGTRVRDVAADAGVAEATVYAVYGTKAGLAMALIDAVEADADLAAGEDEVLAAADDPGEQLAAMARFDRRLFERGGDVLGLVQEAGRSEPELAHAYREGRARADRVRLGVFSTWPPQVFRPGVDPASAVDTYAALCNIEVYRVLAGERGWSPEQIEGWWCDALVRLLLR